MDRFGISIYRHLLGIVVALPVGAWLTWRLFLLFYAPPTGDHVEFARRFESLRKPMLPAGTMVHDDACRTCRVEELDFVALRVQTDGRNYIGHVFLKLPDVAVGFRTREADIGLLDYLLPWSRPKPGVLRDDSRSPFDHERRYLVCPETLRRLQSAILTHAFDAYQVGDWQGGRNCATWASDRLREVGLHAPQGDCPNRLARHLRRVNGTNGHEEWTACGRVNENTRS